MEQRDPLTEQIIGCAIEVHRHLGAGLLEKAYALAMRVELAANGLGFEYERPVPLTYKGVLVGEYRPDLIVEGQVVVEVKSVLHFEPVFHSTDADLLANHEHSHWIDPELQPPGSETGHQAIRPVAWPPSDSP